jgi:hypothetical protein
VSGSVTAPRRLAKIESLFQRIAREYPRDPTLDILRAVGNPAP